MRKKLIVLLFFLLLTTSLSVAQESILLDTVTVKAYFRQGHGTLDSLFRNNGSRLDSFARRLASFRTDTAYRIRSVRVVSGTSPEGSSKINKSLSERRGATIRSYLEKRGSLGDYAFEVKSRGVDWEGLTRLVEASNMPYRAEVLDILGKHARVGHSRRENRRQPEKPVAASSRQSGLAPHGGAFLPGAAGL